MPYKPIENYGVIENLGKRVDKVILPEWEQLPHLLDMLRSVSDVTGFENCPPCRSRVRS